MSVMHSFQIEENERMRKELDELKDFVYAAQVVCSHLLQDGDVTPQGVEAAKSLLLLAIELQDKYDKETKFRGSDS